MATVEVNDFTSYTISEKDYPNACTFSDLQLQHIQNQLSAYAQQKLALSAEDYPHPEVFIRANEYHRGLINGMKFLLELHNTYQQEAVEARKQVERSQNWDQTANDEFRIAGIDSGDDLNESSSTIGHGD
jgi:hypothetical protein